jgi:hypothetical protein
MEIKDYVDTLHEKAMRYSEEIMFKRMDETSFNARIKYAMAFALEEQVALFYDEHYVEDLF